VALVFCEGTVGANRVTTHEVLTAAYQIPCCVSVAFVLVQGFRALLHDVAMWLVQRTGQI
jgi:hypothetical protein